ncbi:hypothetical protein B0J15DRAFT_411436 [Fusarium solani]|uniref:FAD-binding domain-containing protein n=1 Tax=Fusarium solani TaxID=169388 RepID=A0A9P9JRG5_FUSSL|nr:uncharacterized protein B0J15DRAFT_411436 [Fusarium solani]KAH7226035.1 hypothetical protein B0J15DRAFT_411436 [Fusarium solani]
MPGILKHAELNGNGLGNAGQDGPTQPAELPVLIVGGGPTGLLSAYMLSKFGIKSLLIEKYPERLAAPKAHALCPRSLEICRQYGLDTNAMRKLGTPREDANRVNFVTSLSGEHIGLLPYERMDAGVLEHTPEMIHNIPQPAFEQFVAKELEHDPNVEIRKNVAYVTSQQVNDQVISILEECSTKAQWQANLRLVVGERTGMLHWITDPACSGFIIAYDLDANHVLISNFDSKKHPVDTWSQELAQTTVAAAIGQEMAFEVLSYRPWLLSRKVANHYRKRDIFLVGDAAHSFPPTGGLGLNSGIADAHNLAYKIAAVHHGWSTPSILQTYEDDRRQIALVNSAQSIKNGKKIFSFLKTLGTAGIDDVEEARRNLHKSIHDPDKQDMIAREVEGQREHFDNLGLHIGYVYGDKETPPHASKFSPKFTPGGRLPHAWIKPRLGAASFKAPPLDVSYVKEFHQAGINARQFSTLDLVEFDSFTLIVSSHDTWAPRFAQLHKLTQSPGINMRLRSVDEDFDFVFEEQRKMYSDGSGIFHGRGLLVRPDQHLLACVDEKTTAEDLASLILAHLGK